MAEMLDCLVNYFSGDATENGTPRLYICYRLVAGPGVTPDGGVAIITVLAANHSGVWEVAERFHAVSEGGPSAALAKTLRYLESFHDDQYARKVQSEIRGIACHDQWFGQPEGSQHCRATVAAPRIEPMVLLTQMEAGEPLVVLDARSPESWAASTQHIHGDVRIDRDRLEVDPSWSKDEMIVVYCACPHDAEAADVAGWLREQGFGRAYVLHGGLDAWQAASGPLEAK